MKINELLGQDKAFFEDNLYVKTFSTSRTQGGKLFAKGLATASDKKDYGYKIWETDVIEVLSQLMQQSKEQGSPVILKVNGETNIYQNTFGIYMQTLNNIDEVDGKPVVTIMDFLTSDYTVDDLFPRLMNGYKDIVSPKGMELISIILSGELAGKFVQSTSAISHHDSQIHGLLAHTTKMMEVANVVVKNYPSLFETQDHKDLFLIGLLLHDIGKTEEYTLMSPSNRAFLGHRYLGALTLEAHRVDIESRYGSVGADHLISILLQHHGVWDERPKTTLAYAVHLIDTFEAKITDLNENITKSIEDSTTEVFVRTENSESLRLQRLVVHEDNTTTQS